MFSAMARSRPSSVDCYLLIQCHSQYHYWLETPLRHPPRTSRKCRRQKGKPQHAPGESISLCTGFGARRLVPLFHPRAGLEGIRGLANAPGAATDDRHAISRALPVCHKRWIDLQVIGYQQSEMPLHSYYPLSLAEDCSG